MSQNLFLRPTDFYQRKLSPLLQYVEQNSFYLHKMTSRDLQVCRDHVVSSIKNKQHPDARDPVVSYFERGENGDRHKSESVLSHYISSAVKNNEILAPTFTTYLHPSTNKSILVEFIDNNVKLRGTFKKAAFAAKAAGNTDLFIMRNNDQNNMKLYNNSMSGSFATKGSILNNATAHSTLTSTIRSVSSISNASNEKIIAGNRHYYNSHVTLYNLISITSTLDKEKIRETMTKYNLIYPSVSDVVDCIKYSSELYWRYDPAFQKIYEFILRLDEVERAGFVYTSDLYHIRKFNESFVRQFISELSRKVTDQPIENPVDLLNNADEAVINLAHHICIGEMKGHGKKYEELALNDQHTVAATVLNIENTILKYKDFIETFFLTINVPASTAYIPNMIRRTVVLSDTDSTMFAVDEYITWYFGELRFSNEAFGVAASVMFIATQCMAHALAILSANINAAREKLFTLAMKPEFTFPVFAQTSVAKHYYTCIAVKEANVFEDIEMEIKGVHLKNSAAPKSLIVEAHGKMKEILTTVMKNKKISLIEKINETLELERRIHRSILSSEVMYFKTSKIKNSEAYSKTELESPFQFHTFWNMVFAEKYGQVELPPYSVIKIPTTLVNKTAVKNWLETIPDQAISSRLAEWMVRHRKKDIPTIYISQSYVKAFGIPQEIIPVIDIKRIILDLTNVNRMVLESLGYFVKPEWLISDIYASGDSQLSNVEEAPF